MSDDPNWKLELAAAARVLIQGCEKDPALSTIVQTAYQLGFAMGKIYSSESAPQRSEPDPAVGIA